MADRRIFVVFPAHNEQCAIQFTVSAFMAEAERINDERDDGFRISGFVVVDDGSRDATWQVLRDMATAWPSGRGGFVFDALRLSRNFGKEAAILAGIGRARSLGADAVIVADADMQHPPEVMARLIEEHAATGADVVEGVKRDRGRESRLYRWAANAFYGLMTRMAGFDMRSASDYRLLSRRVMDALLAMPERGVFFRGMSSWIGFTRRQVKFDVRERNAGSSTWTPWRLLGLAVRAMTAYSSAPLRLVTAAGGVFLVFAVLMAAQTLWRYWAGQAVTGFATVILLILVTSSLLMLSLGIIGEYLSRIYDEVKARPRFLVAEELVANAEEASDAVHLCREAVGR